MSNKLTRVNRKPKPNHNQGPQPAEVPMKVRMIVVTRGKEPSRQYLSATGKFEFSPELAQARRFEDSQEAEEVVLRLVKKVVLTDEVISIVSVAEPEKV